jgi:hypothetical protein
MIGVYLGIVILQDRGKILHWITIDYDGRDYDRRFFAN